ncbi:MAG: LAGLIDADG family homing endonuclease [Minisyncoccota bacterium]
MRQLNVIIKLRMGRTKPVVSKDYVVGLTDGEGCFFVNMWKSPSYRAGYGIQLHFHIKMQEKDKPLLEKVKNTLQCGAVYVQKERRLNHCQCYRYTVNSHRDILEIVIPFFNKYPLQSVSKKRSFTFFCKIAHLVESGSHLKESGILKIRALKSKMNQKTTGLA